MGSKKTITVTIDLDLLAMRIIESKRRFIRLHELAYELGVSSRTAGKILRGLEKLGYIIRWSDGVYMVVEDYNRRIRGLVRGEKYLEKQ